MNYLASYSRYLIVTSSVSLFLFPLCNGKLTYERIIAASGT